MAVTSVMVSGSPPQRMRNSDWTPIGIEDQRVQHIKRQQEAAGIARDEFYRKCAEVPERELVELKTKIETDLAKPLEERYKPYQWMQSTE